MHHKHSPIFFTATDDIKYICNNFFSRQKITINHLNYIHKCPDGGIFYLCNNYQWIKHYITNQYTNIGAFETNASLAKDRYVLWDSLDSNDVILQDSRDFIHVAHGLTIIHHTKEGTGFFNIGNTHSDITHLNIYINHLNILNEFVLYFYKKTRALFQAAKEQRILPYHSHNISLALESNIFKNRFTFLTKREQDCVYWYLRGKHSGEIAIILGISRRTVETHIEHIKLKFKCTNLFQLGYHIATMQHENSSMISEM